jgi:hypothetical protein
MLLELIVNVFATQYALEVVDLICCQCRVRKRLMVNDGKRCSTVIANCFSHFSILTWHLFPNSNCLVLTHISRRSFRPPLVLLPKAHYPFLPQACLSGIGTCIRVRCAFREYVASLPVSRIVSRNCRMR